MQNKEKTYRVLIEEAANSGEIVRLADWDIMISNVFAKRAIRYLLNYENAKLPKETLFAFELCN